MKDYRCEVCEWPMHAGPAAPVSRGHKQLFECSNPDCENTGYVRSQYRRTTRVKGMEEADEDD